MDKNLLAQLRKKFQSVHGHSEQTLCVRLGDNAFHITEGGKALYNFKETRFVFVGQFSTGLAVARKDKREFHIHRDGKAAYGRQFYIACTFQENTAAVYDKTGWYHISRKGEPLYKERYDDAQSFSEGLAAVKKGRGWFYINKEGKKTIPHVFPYASPFKDGSAVVVIGNKTVSINKQGFVKP